jgi:hypothetical protein
MQIPLLQPEPLVPLPVDSTYYVVALQNRSGELGALRHASEQAWERMTPVVHVVGPKNRGKPLNAPTIRNWVAKLAGAVGSHPFYLDLLRLDPIFPVVTPNGNVPVLEQLFKSARNRQLRFVPIAWVGEDTAAHRKLVEDAALVDGHGLALRFRIRTFVPPGRTTFADYLQEQLTISSCDVTNTDLFVDLGYIDADAELDVGDLAASLEEMLAVGPWRSVVLLGTSIPSMLSCIDEGSVGSVPRREWDLWSQLANCELPRMPSFGDYAVQHPRPPHDGGGPGMRANIRYTANGQTLVARGQGPLIQEGNAQYRQLCQQLISRTEFAGSDFSWGDSVIDDCAGGLLAPGAQSLWRGAGTSHHLELVTEQLRRRQAGS